MLNFVLCEDNSAILNKLSKMLESLFIKHNFDAEIVYSSANPKNVYQYVKDNIVAVADGLGGRGPEQYRDIVTGKIYTSAYIGANTVLESIQSIPAEELNAETLRTAIQNGLNTAKSKYEKVHTGISSSMFKTFPTTLALGYIDNMDLLHAYWCGDSRVYVWESERGLLQISKDDLEDEALNPFTNIANANITVIVAESTAPFLTAVLWNPSKSLYA